jgi:hypothetical protein
LAAALVRVGSGVELAFLSEAVRLLKVEPLLAHKLGVD